MDRDRTAMDREAVVDLGAITANVAALCELVRGSQVLAAVKADGYGHGMVPAARADWRGVVAAALAAQARGSVRVTGLWSHFACADVPGHPSITAQLASFADAVAVAEKAGVTPEVRHIANTAAALTVPESRYDLVRFGGAIYRPFPPPGGPPSQLRPRSVSRRVGEERKSRWTPYLLKKKQKRLIVL